MQADLEVERQWKKKSLLWKTNGRGGTENTSTYTNPTRCTRQRESAEEEKKKKQQAAKRDQKDAT